MKTEFKRPTYKKVDTEKDLLRTLYIRLGSVVLIIAILVVSLNMFGPKIGSLFLLISKNRNNSGPEDTIPPTTPIFSQVPEATKEKTITLNGITEPGATVKIFVNGPEKAQTTADNDGGFTFVDLELQENTNTIFAKAVDSSGNESDTSHTYQIQFDDKKPEIEITNLKDGDTIKNLNKRILIQGKLNESGEVKINDRQAVVKSDNTFELLLGVDEGEVKLNIEAKDKAGNTDKNFLTVTYVKSN